MDYYIFKILIAKNYIYTDTLDTIYDEALGKDNYDGYMKNFDEVIFSVFTDKIRSINDDKYTYLYNPEQYKNIDASAKIEADNTKIEVIDDKIIYIYFPNISKYSYEFLEANKKTLNRYENIIIDLQNNSGGDLNYLYKMEKLFLDEKMTLGYETLRSEFLSKKYISKSPKELEFKNIIILQNKNTASAAEGFITCLDENLPNITKVGSTSFGKGIGQITIPFTSGYAIKATIFTVSTPNNNSIHKVGITPDIVVDENKDVVDEGIKFLHQQ